MKGRLTIALAVVPATLATAWALAATPPAAGAAQAPATPAPKAEPAAAPAQPQTPISVVDRYCIGCHNARAKIGGVAFDTMDRTQLSHDAAIWEEAIRAWRSASLGCLALEGGM